MLLSFLLQPIYLHEKVLYTIYKNTKITKCTAQVRDFTLMYWNFWLRKINICIETAILVKLKVNFILFQGFFLPRSSLKLLRELNKWGKDFTFAFSLDKCRTHIRWYYCYVLPKVCCFYQPFFRGILISRFPVKFLFWVMNGFIKKLNYDNNMFFLSKR